MHHARFQRPIRLFFPASLLLFLSLPGAGTAQTVFRYSFFDDTALPAIPDQGPAHNDATAGPLALLSADIPTEGVPGDAGNASLDTSTPATQATPSGAVMANTLLLSNAEIAVAGGFTMECWFKWNGAGNVNAIIDYAGTEKIVIPTDSPVPGLVQMLISGTGAIPIGVVAAGEWHYVAVVFDTEGQPLNTDGTINGVVRTYLDGLAPMSVATGAMKDNFGDSLVRGIGIGQHPLGFDLDFFAGLVFEPRVSLGALSPEDLLLEATVPAAPSPIFLYSFAAGTPLPDVPDSGGAGNDGLAGPKAALSTDVPKATPAGTGDRSLDSSGDSAAGATGVVTKNVGLLSNAAIATRGGFAMECWFKWNGGGAQNSIIDYAGTEKIVIDTSGVVPGQVEMVFNNLERFPIGVAVPGDWHYVAVVFSTGGRPQNPDDTISGVVATYFDRAAQPTFGAATKDSTGDDRNIGIGVGQAPDGAAGSFFDGLIYAPRVTIGAPAPDELLFVPQPVPTGTLFRYSFSDDMPLPAIPDAGPEGNDATAGALALFTVDDVPEIGVPDDAGNASLDGVTNFGLGDAGIATNRTLLLSNDAIAAVGGFTMESWFKWNGAGDYNAIIDYAGTEKIVLQADAGNGQRTLAMRFDVTQGGYGDVPIGPVGPGEWHYVAVVFDTEGAPVNGNGSLTGTVTTYLDSLEPVGTTPGVTKAAFGDSLVRPIGVGKHPLGYALDFFNGWVFEPRVSLGALAPEDLLFQGGGPPPGPKFIRGNSNADAGINITDGIYILNFLFLGGTAPPCRESADANGDATINITDGIYVLNFLFLGGPAPPAPYPDCASLVKEVDCASFPPCGP
jgi:hypothetical protein